MFAYAMQYCTTLKGFDLTGSIIWHNANAFQVYMYNVITLTMLKLVWFICFINQGYFWLQQSLHVCRNIDIYGITKI
jgi:hypothetical protein